MRTADEDRAPCSKSCDVGPCICANTERDRQLLSLQGQAGNCSSTFHAIVRLEALCKPRAVAKLAHEVLLQQQMLAALTFATLPAGTSPQPAAGATTAVGLLAVALGYWAKAVAAPARSAPPAGKPRSDNLQASGSNAKRSCRHPDVP